jgi:hypothetical protein
MSMVGMKRNFSLKKTSGNNKIFEHIQSGDSQVDTYWGQMAEK